MFIYYRIDLTPNTLLLPIIFIIQLATMIGVTLATSSLYVYYRDIGQLIPVLLTIWMYACPIIYPISAVPDWLLPWYMLNPMAFAISGYRQVLLLGETPNLLEMVFALVVSTIILVVGALIFVKLEDQFADLI